MEPQRVPSNSKKRRKQKVLAALRLAGLLAQLVRVALWIWYVLQAAGCS